MKKEFWKSLNDLARSEEFEDVLRDEFPRQAMALDAGVDRRDFVKLMGASMALAGLTGCDPNRPPEKIIPYVRQPEDLIPGKPLFFASAMTLSGFGYGVLVESHMNRPTKIEGNPDHPATLGASDPFMQASILGLYDPDRSQVVRNTGEISTWSAFIAALQQPLKNPKGLRLLTQTITSPTIGAQIQQLLAQNPGMQWHQWEPVSRDNVREGLRAAFGNYVNAIYHFEKANVVVSLDAGFMDSGPGHLRYAHDFASRRRVRQGQPNAINRLYAIESMPSSSGAVGDHRIPVRASQVEDFARGLFGAINGGGQPVLPVHQTIAKDLMANRGASIVIAGDDQPPAVHAIAMAINQLLGNIGSTVLITDPVEVAPTNQLESLRALVTDMNNGAVQSLVMIGGNPVFDAPADFNFAEAFKKVPFRAHLAGYYNETSMLCHWHVPETHDLESWSDVRSYDGTVSIVQPLIAPLYNGRSVHEVLTAMIGGLDVSPYDQVRGFWGPKIGANFEATWRQWLNDGVIRNSALPPRAATASTTIAPATGNPLPALELQLRPDPTIYDGRFANLGWLQELPKPQTKVTWDNVLLVSPKTADDFGYGDREREALINEKQTILVDLKYRGRTIRVPMWPMPGHPDGCATLHFGYGREHGGKVASPPGGTVGVNVYPIRFSDALAGGGGAQLTRADAPPYTIACTQEHQSINLKDMGGGERGIIHVASFAEYQRDPHFAHGELSAEAEAQSMWPQYKYERAWAMVIDPSVCTSCNGCVIACQSENNIAVVGKEQVAREREMQWLRIDRYFRGPAENPEVYNQPVPCMQCEQAPCEPVCPVEATAHSSEGLNDMTYNRCVGTRYCSNNCPYKVRRFNFLFYSDWDTPALKPMRNPNVTVRTRGVMEKCTYCVQRINAARIEAEKQNRPVRDGEAVTACQQACPTEAIVFGDMHDPQSRVAKLKKEPQNYAMLPELNTRPRTTYLGIVKNPNPELKV